MLLGDALNIRELIKKIKFFISRLSTEWMMEASWLTCVCAVAEQTWTVNSKKHLTAVNRYMEGLGWRMLIKPESNGEFVRLPFKFDSQSPLKEKDKFDIYIGVNRETRNLL